MCVCGTDRWLSSLEEVSVEIVSRLLIFELSRTFLALAAVVGFFVFADATVADDEESFLFGVVFGGANGCCGETEPGFGVTTACVTIFRGLPRGAFLSLSFDFDPLKYKIYLKDVSIYFNI